MGRSSRRIAYRTTLGMAATALWHNRLRSGLTMLGVVIGIAAVITVTSVGQGIQKAAEQRIQALGTNVVLVTAGTARTGGISQGLGSASTLTLEDAQAIAQQVPAAKAVTAFLQRPVQVVYGGENTSTQVLGTDLNYPIVRNIRPQMGRYFIPEELESARSVVVLGSQVRDELFGQGQNAVGASIRIQGERYTVIGVMEAKGAVGPQNLDDQVYIPLRNMSARLVGNNTLNGIAISGLWVQTWDESRLKAAQYQVTNLLRIRHNIFPPQPDDFRVTNQGDLVSTFSSIVGMFTVLVSAIAGISLVVGGVGIANIMLVSVVERTQEIGIRKALGASQAAILAQFLAEAVAISLVGGGVGMVCGITLSWLAATLLRFPFIVSPASVVAGVCLSFVIGLLAGVIPARNAARLDPIAALRRG